MAVNLAAHQFRAANLTEKVRGTLQQSGLEARFLEFELTETAVMQDAEQSALILQQLSELGVRLSLDDFGTGYSSLSYLQRFPLNKVKIDRSFVREIDRSESNAEIVRAIVSLAHSLRLSVVAEGVETIEQLDSWRRSAAISTRGTIAAPPCRPKHSRRWFDPSCRPLPAAEWTGALRRS